MKDFIDEFISVVENAAKQLNSISSVDSGLKNSTLKWSKKETLGHLIDSSINNTTRIVLGQFQEELIFQGYDQDDWVRVQNYQVQDWQFLIELWRLSNLHLIQIVKEIPPNILKKEHLIHNFDKILFKEYTQNKSATLEMLIKDYLIHLKHHLNQIFS